MIKNVSRETKTVQPRLFRIKGKLIISGGRIGQFVILYPGDGLGSGIEIPPTSRFPNSLIESFSISDTYQEPQLGAMVYKIRKDKSLQFIDHKLP